MKNIVLIGMPGAGKSTVGKLVAARLNLPFLDTDDMIAAEAGCSIPEIFARDGEAHFRAMETDMARRAGTMDGAVIATGGGMILRRENMDALGAAGIFFFLDRPPEELARQTLHGRPLLAGGRARIFELYTHRIELYRDYAKYTISDATGPDDAAGQIIEILEGLS